MNPKACQAQTRCPHRVTRRTEFGALVCCECGRILKASLPSWWASFWYSGPSFTLGRRPWWVCGPGPDRRCVHVALDAVSELEVRKIIERACERVRWRYVERKYPGWSPFSDRFPKADWMRWPETQSMHKENEDV